MRSNKLFIMAGLLALAIACGDDSTSNGDDGPNNNSDVVDQTDTSNDSDASGESDTGGESDTSDPTGETGFEEFKAQAADAMAELYCRAAFECPDEIDTGLFILFSRAGSYDDCIANFDKIMPMGIAYEDQNLGIEAGRMTYDAQAGAQCLAALDSLKDECLSIDEIVDHLEADCISPNGPFVGQREEGEPCLTGDECTSARCEDDPEDRSACYGICAAPAPRVGEGEACEYNDDCRAGLFCALEMLDTGDEEGVCTASGGLEPGDACEGDSSRCPDGYFCSRQENNTCIPNNPRGNEGDSCDLEEKICVPGLVCSLDPTDGGGTCAQPAGQGDDCIITYECALGLYCAPSGEPGEPGNCQPVKDEGDACAGSFVAGECDLPLECNEETLKCEIPSDKAACEVPDP